METEQSSEALLNNIQVQNSSPCNYLGRFADLDLSWTRVLQQDAALTPHQYDARRALCHQQ